jgi:thioredoxin reductase (NADPH)
MIETYDVIIVGAGPAGMAAAVYTGRARLETLILEKGMPGGQILLTDFVENYPGYPEGVVPFELMGSFRKHAEKFGARIETDEVKGIRKEGELWHGAGNKGGYSGQAVIIATGSTYRKLGFPEEAKLTGRGISYCGTCDGAFFKDKEVAVVGGGDHALTEALFLTKFCSSVKIIHRRDKFRGERIIQERVFANEKIEVLWDSVIQEIKGEDKLESISIKNVKDGTIREIKIDGLFVSVGMDPNSSLAKGLVEMDEKEQIKVSQTMATSQPGIFAAGDVTNACPQQMSTAVGTGVAAALAVDEYLSKKA